MQVFQRPVNTIGRPSEPCGRHLAFQIDFGLPRHYTYDMLIKHMQEKYGVSFVHDLSKTQAIEVLRMFKNWGRNSESAQSG